MAVVTSYCGNSAVTEHMGTPELIDEIYWHINRIVNSGEYEVLFSKAIENPKALYVWVWYDPERDDEGPESTEHVLTVTGLRTNTINKLLKEFDLEGVLEGV